jgi:signal transduction histidine kinase
MAIRGYRKKIKEKGIALDLKEMNGEIVVLADKDKIVEALSNLIDNAVKLTDEGTVNIRTKNEKGLCIVEVADTGKGIPQDLLDRLFEKEQIPGGSPMSRNGLELGLYMAKYLMELQRGSISASSVVGKGSSFALRIPSAKFEIPLSKV